MNELEITARELILAIMEKTLKSLKNNGLLKEPSKLQMLCSSPEMKSLIKKLAPPKYDPNRLFKKGDKVRPIELNGRIFSLYWKDKIGKLLTVTSSESFDYVELPEVDGQPIAPAYLELVTPVEELEPFLVCQDAEMECFEVYKHEYTEGEESEEKVWKIVRTTYFYGDNQGLRTLAEAKAAAKAECARLNAEYRKEQE